MISETHNALSILVDEDHMIIYGDNSVGQHGFGDNRDVDQPTIWQMKVDTVGVDQPKDIIAGWDHVLAMFTSGEVRSWGNNDAKQCYHPTANIVGLTAYQQPNPFDGTNAERRKLSIYAVGKKAGFAVSSTFMSSGIQGQTFFFHNRPGHILIDSLEWLQNWILSTTIIFRSQIQRWSWLSVQQASPSTPRTYSRLCKSPTAEVEPMYAPSRTCDPIDSHAKQMHSFEASQLEQRSTWRW
jgi:hypothetical protein